MEHRLVDGTGNPSNSERLWDFNLGRSMTNEMPHVSPPLRDIGTPTDNPDAADDQMPTCTLTASEIFPPVTMSTDRPARGLRSHAAVAAEPEGSAKIFSSR